MAFLSVVLLAQALLILALVLRVVYRLTLHPLSRFPGPKFAAATNLYAIYYDLLSGDSLVKHLKALHDEYGPIVRVRPGELHIFDWDAYRMVFKAGSDFNRAPEFYNAPMVEGSFLNVSDGRVAKPHRDLFIQAFSRAQINGLEPLIHEKVDLFLHRLQEEASQNKSIDLVMAYECLTADVTMYYCYQMSLGLLDAPNFRPKLIVEFHEFDSVVPFFWYFPNIGNVLNKVIFSLLPESAVKTWFPGAASMKDVMNVRFDYSLLRATRTETSQQCKDLIDSLARAPADSKEVESSIFRNALSPDREKGQYIATPRELAADAVLVFLAGTDTTAHALTFGTWEMIKRPEIWTRLRQEVMSVLPETQGFARLADLEKLPFLATVQRGVVKESLRFSMGTSARLHRIVPQQGAVFCGETIAPGTRVSFSHYLYNNDPAVFLDPFSFKPERWMEPNADELERHMVSFSRGSRSCIGMKSVRSDFLSKQLRRHASPTALLILPSSLAYAELYTTFARLARRFDLVNDGTTGEMMDWTDSYTPRFKGSLKVKPRAC
ncbi:benzoate 4-monooxygenase cytochrome P450 [Cladophialophora carrionii]|uniref:Benzoate 4-monooxygenase cytochrome P450 n=1 Tax=Cladophialophora carrionii TaxID=86049 RepID=A0A1C1CD48_9EURO|nr:benzoate 4-monooxygenase cytochrome P450 [Cladophialophora carrionii]